jgi:hypothetical protein
MTDIVISIIMLIFSRSSTSAVLIGGPNRPDLDKVCEVLNSAKYPERRDSLREIVQRWRASGPNLEKMLDADQILAASMQAAWYSKVSPSKKGRAYLVLNPTKLRFSTHEYVAGMFAVLTLNPDCEKLSGPCAYSPCGKYFIRKGKRLTAHCSRRCCQLASAVRYTKRRLGEEREDKLNRTRVAIEKWKTARSKDDWKTSVCKQEPDVTKKFLTRAVTKRTLVEPRSRAA